MLTILSGTVLALTTVVLGQDSPDVLVLVGKPYPQYEQASSAFSQEWKKSTGRDPSVAAFPNEESAQDGLLGGRPSVVVCLGEAPTTWAVRQPENFVLSFSMVVGPERIKELRETSPIKERDLTGISIEVPIDEQLAIVVQLMPRLKRVGLITQDPALRENVVAIRLACEKNKLELVHTELSETSELPEKLDLLLGQVDLLWSIPDSNVCQPQLAQHIIGQSAARGVPLLGLSATFVKAGATFSFERDYREIGQLLAQHYLRRGEPSDVDSNWLVKSPQGVVLSVNQRSFEALGLSMKDAGAKVQVAKY
jgi:putative ABC transport system substrate-binding protein